MGPLKLVKKTSLAWAMPCLLEITRRAFFCRAADPVHGRRRLTFFLLPAYAPELNPVKAFWAYLKTNPLSNRPFDEPFTLAKVAKRHARHIAKEPDLLRSFLFATPLFCPK